MTHKTRCLFLLLFFPSRSIVGVAVVVVGSLSLNGHPPFSCVSEILHTSIAHLSMLSGSTIIATNTPKPKPIDDFQGLNMFFAWINVYISTGITTSTYFSRFTLNALLHLFSYFI